MSSSEFGDYSHYDLVGEHYDWINLTAPAKEKQVPNSICENGEYCIDGGSFKNEWVVNFAGSRWCFLINFRGCRLFLKI